jgi:hypothetical protein
MHGQLCRAGRVIVLRSGQRDCAGVEACAVVADDVLATAQLPTLAGLLLRPALALQLGQPPAVGVGHPRRVPGCRQLIAASLRTPRRHHWTAVLPLLVIQRRWLISR